MCVSHSIFCYTGNIFCTLGGHIFDWTLLPDESATHQQAPPEEILNFIPFEESSYSTDPAIRILEEKVGLVVYGCAYRCGGLVFYLNSPNSQKFEFYL